MGHLTNKQQARILAQMQREPDRKADQTASWSLSLLQRKKRLIELAYEQAEAAGIVQLNAR